MTTYDSETFTIGASTYVEDVESAAAETFTIFGLIEDEQCTYCEPPILLTLTGSGINPIPIYFLAMFDSFGVRRYWLDTYPSTNGAPTLGAGTYDHSTFTILGRY